MAAYPRILRRVRDTAKIAEVERPDVAILIDSWGFTMRVAHRLRRINPALTLIKYVGPQVWATRPGRAKLLARAVDHLLTIHAFDAPLFEAAGLPVTFVGNAALKTDFSDADPARLRNRLGVGINQPLLAVLPGSRPGEIKRVLPAFLAAVDLLRQTQPDLAVVIPAAPTVAGLVREAVRAWGQTAHIVEGDAAKLDAMKAATVAMACSGTVTLELALAGCPMVVAYRLGTMTHWVLKQLILTPYVTLFNIAAQAFVAPELIQDDCNPEALALEVGLRLADANIRSAQIDAQFKALDKMGRGGPDPSDAAAEAILGLIGQPRISTAV